MLKILDGLEECLHFHILEILDCCIGVDAVVVEAHVVILTVLIIVVVLVVLVLVVLVVLVVSVVSVGEVVEVIAVVVAAIPRHVGLSIDSTSTCEIDLE